MVSAIKRYHKKRGVKSTSIHKYRHTFAKLAIMKGIDPLRLQKILGHSTLDMTRKYVNLFGIDLKEGFNKYNPLEQFNHYKETIKVK
ncbi:MAG: tyrosine-type recombinase/integrase [Halanaerobiales bacterium]